MLEKKPWALTGGGEFRRQFESLAKKESMELRPAHICTSFTQAAQLVRTGVAAAVLPEIAQFAAPVRKLTLGGLEPPKRSLGIVWHPRNIDVRPVLESVRKLLIEVTAM